MLLRLGGGSRVEEVNGENLQSDMRQRPSSWSKFGIPSASVERNRPGVKQGHVVVGVGRVGRVHVVCFIGSCRHLVVCASLGRAAAGRRRAGSPS